MRVLVGCEYSNTVAGAFRWAGHETWSCDLLPSEGPERFHYQCDIYIALTAQDWDLVILHPPCTALCVAGNRYYSQTQERADAIEWTTMLFQTATRLAGRVALENPVSVLSSAWRKPDQYIHPWQFGHGEMKKTGLWLNNLPKLEPTDIVDGREQRIWKMSPHPDRAKERSRFYPGIAKAMVKQWGSL